LRDSHETKIGIFQLNLAHEYIGIKWNLDGMFGFYFNLLAQFFFKTSQSSTGGLNILA